MDGNDLHALEGPALLLAGPGTGKTYRLGRRIKYLIEQLGVAPESMTVITFTAAAATNMRDCISDESQSDLFLPYSSQPALICTIHSLGYRIIRENAASFGLRQPIRVVTDDHLRSVLTGDAAQLCGSPRKLGIEVADCRRAGACQPDEGARCDVCRKYRTILKACNAIDYDDQVLLACDLLKDNASLLADYTKTSTHLLVDEYQDINEAQYRLIRLLSDGNPAGLFVVGDDDQSIYSWRGGSPAFISSFRERLGDKAKVVPLQKSFRCHKHVLEGATAMVRAFNPDGLDKGGYEYKTESGPKIKIHSAPSDEKEARVVREIVQRVLPSQDVLILVPQRSFAQTLITELRKHRIAVSAPVPAPGKGLPLIATLAEWLNENTDSLALRACIEALLESPASSVPSKRVRKTEKLRAREEAYSVVSSLWEPVVCGSRAGLWEVLQEHEGRHPLLQHVWCTLSRLRALSDKADGLPEFLGVTARDVAPWRRVGECLSELSAWVENAEQVGRAGSTGSFVRIMTLQGAKGLQARIVIVLGLEEGSLPRSDGREEIPEQSRLLFVSMTRAINELHLFHARKRSAAVAMRPIYREGAPPDIQPSRFLKAIPGEHCEKVFHRA